MKISIRMICEIGVLLLIAAVIYLAVRLNKSQRSYKRQANNVMALTSAPVVKYIHDSIRVTTVAAVTENVKELERQNLVDRKLIGELRMKLKDVRSYETTQSTITDTVRLVERADSMYEYNDRWMTLKADMRDKTCEYSVNDSITTIVNRIYKHHFLFLRWGFRGYGINIINWNPHAKTSYLRHIEVDK